MGCKARRAANGHSIGKRRNAADRPQNLRPYGLQSKRGARRVALLGIVVRATTFVARLAIPPF